MNQAMMTEMKRARLVIISPGEQGSSQVVVILQWRTPYQPDAHKTITNAWPEMYWAAGIELFWRVYQEGW